MNKRLRPALSALTLAFLLGLTALTASGITSAMAYAAETVSEEAAPSDTAADSTSSRVMWVVLFVWLGIGAYLFKIDRSIARLERKIDER
jgi:CcmD family protein